MPRLPLHVRSAIMFCIIASLAPMALAGIQGIGVMATVLDRPTAISGDGQTVAGYRSTLGGNVSFEPVPFIGDQKVVGYSGINIGFQ